MMMYTIKKRIIYCTNIIKILDNLGLKKIVLLFVCTLLNVVDRQVAD